MSTEVKLNGRRLLLWRGWRIEQLSALHVVAAVLLGDGRLFRTFTWALALGVSTVVAHRAVAA